MKGQLAGILLAAIVLVSGAAVHGEEIVYSAASGRLPRVSREMMTPGFWIGLHPRPNDLVLDRRGINAFNSRVRNELKLTGDLLKVPDVLSGAEIRQQMEARWGDLKEKGYFTPDGQTALPAFFDGIRDQMALEAIPAEVPLQYGLVTRFADQRFLPVREGLYAKVYDIDFDELQNSGLDVGSGVVILHQSADGQWFYAWSELSEGWVEAERVALCSRREFKEYLTPRQWVVITAGKADLYLDKSLTRHFDHARMGMKFPSAGRSPRDALTVKIPTRDALGRLELKTAFIHRDQVSSGFLPYTPAAILEQAFKLLHEPYGWGDSGGEQDCSRFLQEIFATVGIFLPRDSVNQAQTGVAAAVFEPTVASELKVSVLGEETAAGALLYMKGHILLYLGMVEGRPYAIHAVWAYREPDGEEDRIRVINRVAVSDLLLGEGSKKGSLLERLTRVIELKN